MRIYAISDLHLSINNPKPMNIFGHAWDNYIDVITADWKDKVASEDVVLIAGDISWAMYLENAKPDIDFIAALPGNKIILRGNHDYWWKSISAVRSMLPEGMFALQNDSVKIGDVVFCGSRGWTVPDGKTQTEDDKKIFDREVIRMGLSISDAEKKRGDGDKTVAMIHYPPFNGRLEPSPFTQLFDSGGVNAVVYGHLHGASRAEKLTRMGGIDYYLTSCDMVGNHLVEIKI